MNSLQTLLVATDLSAPSRHAAQRAAMLAQQAGARLELVHVLERGSLDELRRLFHDDGEAAQGRVREQAREALSQLTSEVGETLGVSAGHHLLEGAVLDSIGMQAELLNAALLIIGARGASGMRAWLLGATAERLLGLTRRPILLVRQAPREPYRKVIVAVDCSPWSMQSIRLAQAVAPSARLILLHAYDVPFEGKMRLAGVDDDMIKRYAAKEHQEVFLRLKQSAREAGIPASWQQQVIHGDAAAVILQQQEEEGADLIVLGKHGVGMVEELLLGSVTKHVLAEARCDTLVAAR
ncbi:universal stress protein [Candidatus Accumulibacter phosphatis]|jgi:nucleotide-binding universal stress UspA family protein|uniref:Universal stress protein n=1 Tax=Candidatus Accumulibacter phosphatis TaxID=327160 RepID=A0ABX1U4N3_9PROT|nr:MULTISPECIES: universal stress protein [Candidatus Accumulibacter]NMQ30294.1 universal stress protein [Candidatus Accumulibacter phosphatis]